MRGEYDFFLVVISFFVAVFASLAAINSALKALRMPPGKQRILRLIAGAVVLGFGIWSMHFIGMVAYKLPIEMTYDITLTLISVIPAIFTGFITLIIICRKSARRLRIITGGSLCGLGIILMHYTGMAAMEKHADIYYEPTLFIFSIIIAVAFAVLALRIRFYALNPESGYTIGRSLFSALIMGTAITLMHYTGMAATLFFPKEEWGLTSLYTHISQEVLIAMIIITIVLTLALTIITTLTGTIYKKKIFMGHVLSISLAFFIIIGLSSWFALYEIERQTRKELTHLMEHVLNKTHKTFNIWLKARYHDLAHWVKIGDVGKNIASLLELPPDPESLKKSPQLKIIRESLKPLMSEHDDLGFFIISRDYLTYGSLHDEGLGMRNLIAEKGDYLTKVFQGQKQLILPIPSDIPLPDLKGRLTPNEPTMFIAVPIYDDANTIIAAFTVRLNPSLEISSIVQMPRKGSTGDTYFFDKSGRFITEPRFRKKLRNLRFLAPGERMVLNYSIKDPGGNLLKGYETIGIPGSWPFTRMVKSAVSGKDGIDLNGYRNYVGATVVGAWLWDNVVRLGITFEMEYAEAYQTFFYIRRIVVIIMILVVILFLAAVWWITQNQKKLISINRRLSKAITINKQVQTEIQSWRKRYETAATSTGHILYDWNIVTNKITYGGPLEQILGYTAAEMSGGVERWRELIHPEDLHRFDDELDKILVNKKATHLTYRLRCKNDHYIYIENIGRFHNDSRGQSTRIVGFIKDITHQQEARQELASSEERFRAIAHTATSAIITIDQEGVIIHVNPSAVKMFGYDHEDELLNQSVIILMPVKYRLAHSNALQDLLAYRISSWTSRTLETNGLKKDGSDIPVEISLSKWESDNNYFFSAIIRDISEEKRFEKALKKSAQRLKKALEIAQLGAWEWDLETGALEWSDSFAHIFGIKKQNFTPTYLNLISLIHPEDRHRFETQLHASIDNKEEAFKIEHRIILPNKDIRFIIEQGEVVCDIAGNPVRVISISQDITAEKHQE